MNIRGREQVPGGYLVTVEVPGAYSDGSSRFDSVFVPRDALAGKSREERLAAVREAWADRLDDLVGAGIAAEVAQTKAVLEARMAGQYDRWQRWQRTRMEAQARTLPAAVVTALTAAENAAWADYLAALQVWRATP